MPEISVTVEVGGKPYAKNSVSSTACRKGGRRCHTTVRYLHDLTAPTMTKTFSRRAPRPS